MLAIRKHLVGVTALAFTIVGFTPISNANDHWSDKWEIQVKDDADSPGTISFAVSFEPDDGVAATPVVVEVPVPDNTDENDIAELITIAFRGVLGDDDFKIKRSDGEKIIIKTRGGTPDIAVEIKGNTVQGISLEIES